MEREFEPLEEGIHVCYALSDPQGTYSKFAGASICSLLERTAAKVTVHILSDETLSGENQQRFRQLVEAHGQEIRFYDMPRAVAGTWERARRIYPEGLQSETVQGGFFQPPLKWHGTTMDGIVLGACLICHSAPAPLLLSLRFSPCHPSGDPFRLKKAPLPRPPMGGRMR